MVDFLVGRFSKQLDFLGNKSIDCITALSGFAVDTAVLAPIIEAGIGIGTAATAPGLGAPVGLSVITAAVIASTYLTMEGVEANNKCQDAIKEAHKASSKNPSGNTQLKVDAKTLSGNSLDLFKFIAQQDRTTLLRC